MILIMGLQHFSTSNVGRWCSRHLQWCSEQELQWTECGRGQADQETVVRSHLA